MSYAASDSVFVGAISCFGTGSLILVTGKYCIQIISDKNVKLIQNKKSKSILPVHQ